MKLLSIVMLAAFALCGCATLPGQPTEAQQQQQARDLVSSLNDATTKLHDTATALHDAAKAVATPPSYIPPGATQPVILPSPIPDKTLQDISKKLDDVATKIDKGASIPAAAVAAATQPAANPVSVVLQTSQAAADSGLIPPPYDGYVKWGVALLGAGWGLLQASKAKQATTATASVTDAVKSGLASGMLIAKPGASNVVDASVNGHPSTDAIVDVVRSAESGAQA